MNMVCKNNGSVILMVIFVVTLLATIVMGMLQINTEEIQLVQNQIYAAQALGIAEAGLNDAFAELRDDPDWRTGFTDKAFANGKYTVTVTELSSTASSAELQIISTGTTSNSYVAIVDAEVTVSLQGFPHKIRTNRRFMR